MSEKRVWMRIEHAKGKRNKKVKGARRRKGLRKEWKPKQRKRQAKIERIEITLRKIVLSYYCIYLLLSFFNLYNITCDKKTKRHDQRRSADHEERPNDATNIKARTMKNDQTTHDRARSNEQHRDGRSSADHEECRSGETAQRRDAIGQRANDGVRRYKSE